MNEVIQELLGFVFYISVFIGLFLCIIQGYVKQDTKYHNRKLIDEANKLVENQKLADEEVP